MGWQGETIRKVMGKWPFKTAIKKSIGLYTEKEAQKLGINNQLLKDWNKIVAQEFTEPQAILQPDGTMQYYGEAYFAAQSKKRKDKKGKPIVYGLVVIWEIIDGPNPTIMMKAMDEGSGPHYYRASRKLMKKLSPLADFEQAPDIHTGWARNWRAAVEIKLNGGI